MMINGRNRRVTGAHKKNSLRGRDNMSATRDLDVSVDEETVPARPGDKEEECSMTSDVSKITKDFDKISVFVQDLDKTESSNTIKKKSELVDLTTSSPTKGSLAVRVQSGEFVDLVTSNPPVLDVTSHDPKTIDLTTSGDMIIAKDPDFEMIKSIVYSPTPKNQKIGISGKPVVHNTPPQMTIPPSTLHPYSTLEGMRDVNVFNFADTTDAQKEEAEAFLKELNSKYKDGDIWVSSPIVSVGGILRLGNFSKKHISDEMIAYVYEHRYKLIVVLITTLLLSPNIKTEPSIGTPNICKVTVISKAKSVATRAATNSEP